MSPDGLFIYSSMRAFSRQKKDNIKRAGESYSLPSFSAVVFSLILHGSVFAVAFFAIGDFGKSEITLPEVQEVIEVEIVEDLPPKKKETQTIVPAPRVAQKAVSKKEVSQKTKIIPPAVAEIKPHAGQKASISRGSFSRERYVQKLTRHIASHKYYPKSARQRRMEGKVIVSFTIDTQGKLYDARIVKSSKSHLLDNAALTTLRRAEPFPLLEDTGRQRDMSFNIPINYSLK